MHHQLSKHKRPIPKSYEDEVIIAEQFNKYTRSWKSPSAKVAYVLMVIFKLRGVLPYKFEPKKQIEFFFKRRHYKEVQYKGQASFQDDQHTIYKSKLNAHETPRRLRLRRTWLHTKKHGLRPSMVETR